ncbi:MAG: serine/threonine protein kinase [Planctomycetia bacterium]|nr:serine/threonine protein kinase [Planctomycetia bacterium]
MNASPKAKDIFLAALDVKSPAEKQAYLDSACADDQALRLEVEEMLVHHEKLGSFLQSPIVDLSPTIDQAPTEDPGTVIGPYKLLQEIGHGGMGVVFMAEQSQPVKRRVALKIIKPGMDSRQVIARFEAERQALSLMDHPNIAKVLDAGTTSTGRPYFVMELVKGQPITKYCDEHHMTPRQRLELLLPVCQAIQHAHQKGIIHRDIKPSNILVAEYDSKPVPKVIDFGVAKAIHQPLTDKTMFTGFGNIVGTLEYMSPEQAQVNQLDIDTRSDIYSLGVLMYELLTSTTPIDRKRLKKVAWDEMLRIVREEDPPKPSTRLSSTEELPSIAANRGIEPRKLSSQVHGELDWIVMKALEKDRNRRYETANSFAMDLQRYLANEPVLACPPSLSYQMRKFVGRNKGPVFASSLVLMALLAGVIGTTWGLIRTEEQRFVVERQRNDLEARNKALQAAHERERILNERARQAIETVSSETAIDQLTRERELRTEQKDFLDKILQYYTEFAREAAPTEQERTRQALAYFRMGRLNQVLGRDQDSETAYRRAAGLFKQLADEFPNNPEHRKLLAGSYGNLGVVLSKNNQPEAESAYVKAMEIYKQLADGFPKRPEFRQALSGIQSNLGNLLHGTGRPKEAEAAHLEALAIRKQLVSEFPKERILHRALAMSHNNLGWVLQSSGRLKEAELAYTEAIANYKQIIPHFPFRPEFRKDLGQSYHNLANVLRATERPKEAAAAHAEALAIFRELVAEFPNRPEFSQELADAERK